MFKATWIVLLPIGILLAADCHADDSGTTDTDREQITPEKSVAMTASAEREFSYLWQTRYPVGLTTYSDDWPGTIGELEFQDTSIFGRFSQLRNLSFLTLAEFGQRRLFLGINEDGLVGVHLGAFSDQNDQRYLEVVRLPYLDELDTKDEVEQVVQEAEKRVTQQISSIW